MTFKVLISDKLKDRSLQSLFDFINGLQSADWGLAYYGFGVDRRDIQASPKRGSIPTNYGCIIFPLFYYNEMEFIKYAEEYLDNDKWLDLKNKFKEEGFIDISSEVDDDVIRKVASEHPSVVESAQIELILPVIVNVENIPGTLEGALRFFKRQSKRMEKLVDFSKKVPAPFDDVEVHQWNMHYADPRDIDDVVKRAGGDEELIKDYLHGIVAELEEEQEEKGYVIILRTAQDAKLSIRQLEKRLDEALAPVKRHISRKTAFVTLVL
jgi:hypothetical protein